MATNLTRRQTLQGMMAAGAVTVLPGMVGVAFAQAGPLVITTYGGRYEKFWREELLPDFTKKTGIETVVDIGVGTQWAATMRAAGPDNPPFSHIMTNELVGAVLRSEGFFQPWDTSKIPNLANTHPKAIIGNADAITAMVSPIGIAYRPDLVKTPPTGWASFWDNAEFRGKLGLFGIQNTAGFMFLMMVSQIFGKDSLDFEAGLAKVAELKPFPQGDLAGALAVLLTRGEIVACPLDLGETINLKKKGVAVEFVAPSEGMFYFDQTFDLLKNAPNADGSSAFIDYMLSEDVQIKLAREFSAVPVNTKVTLPPDIAETFPLTINDLDTLVTFNWIEANKQRSTVTDSWNRMTS